MISSIGPTLDPTLFIADLGTRKRDSALLEMARRACAQGAVCEIEVVHHALLMRERLGTTAVGRGIAIPNVRSIAVTEPCLVVARSRRGVEWAAADSDPVHVMLMLLSPAEFPVAHHLDLLARVVTAARASRARQKLLDAESAADAAAVLREVLG
jgi:mannitol/fructose-specific phosphotransferase system IIA component (Ntr-type)